MNNSCKKLIKKQDVFGKKVDLNFNQNGPIHKTYFGGFITIFYSIFIIVFVAYGFQNIQNHSKDKISVQQNYINMQDLGTVYFNESGMLIYSLIQGSQVKNDFDNLKRYLDIYYQVCIRDSSRSPSCISTRRVEAKKCQQDDFGYNPDSMSFYKSLQSQMLICPDYKNGSLYLNSDQFNIKFARIDLMINTCKNITNLTCFDNQQLEVYLSDLQVRVYQLSEQVNLQIYQRDPIQMINQNLQNYHLLTSYKYNQSQVYQFQLQKNIYATFDQLFNIGESSFEGQFFNIAYFQSFVQNFIKNGTQQINLMRVSLFLYGQQQTHTRKTYGILDIGGEVGGLSASLIAALQIICYPIAAFNFELIFLKKMYTAKTNNTSIFRQIKVKQNKTEDKNLNQEQNVRTIQFSLLQSIKFYLSNYKCFKKLIPNYHIYKKLNDEYKKRINREMDILQILQTIGYLKTAVNFLITHTQITEIQQKIREKNVISLDQKLRENEQLDMTQNQLILNYKTAETDLNLQKASNSLTDNQKEHEQLDMTQSQLFLNDKVAETDLNLQKASNILVDNQKEHSDQKKVDVVVNLLNLTSISIEKSSKN